MENIEKEEGFIIIKKYPNRRLYNTEESQYINLEDVARMIRAEKNIRVIDSASGSDITKDIMLQIIAESPYGKEFLPLDFLKSLIHMGSDTVRGMMKKFMEEQSDLAGRMQKFMWTGIETNPLTNLWIKLASDYYRQNPEAAGKHLDEKEEKDKIIHKLREQISALQQKLNKPARKKPGKNKPRKTDKS